jgi:hypothetical protein
MFVLADDCHTWLSFVVSEARFLDESDGLLQQCIVLE